MKSIFPFAVLTIIALTIAVGCVKPPNFPDEPVIEYVQGSMAKDTMLRGNPDSQRDTNFFTLSFTDGDGDLGEKTNSSKSLIIVDNRKGVSDSLRIPEVLEQGATNGIKGELYVRMFTTCCIYPDSLFSTDFCKDEFDEYPYDVVNYSVYIFDKSGNKSNTVELPPVYIRCFD
jgi:hypothetical protein